VIRFIVNHSRISEEKLKELMFKTGNLSQDIGTSVTGPDAVRYGLIGKVGGIGEAIQELNRQIKQRKNPIEGGILQ
jgi:ATP-dependent protease ClpP protease subunit